MARLCKDSNFYKGLKFVAPVERVDRRAVARLYGGTIICYTKKNDC